MRIIQFLNWDFNSIIPYLDLVKRQNFDTIQINPVQPFIKVSGNDWWASYQPLDFKIGNEFGNKEDLKKLCKEAKKRGINIVVDVITNHLANNGQGKETEPHRDIDESIRDNSDYWKHHKKVNAFESYEDVITVSIGLPGLNLKNEELQNIILNFLDELRECGVSGFRFDAAKHIGLPSDGVSYFNKVKEFLDKNNLFGYAEFLDGPNDLGNDFDKTLYDKKNEFTDLMYILTDENSKVKDASKKVTFVESHDTYLNGNGSTKNKSLDEIIDKYVTLTKKYENTLFYVRDKKRGQSIESPNREEYADMSWATSEKIRIANKNTGTELRNIESQKNKEIEGSKERIYKYLHHDLAMIIHGMIIDEIKGDISLDECISLARLDYYNQINLNKVFEINTNTFPDSFLIDCIANEFYKNKWYKQPLNNVVYGSFVNQFSKILQERGLNVRSTDAIDEKLCPELVFKTRDVFTREITSDYSIQNCVDLALLCYDKIQKIDSVFIKKQPVPYDDKLINFIASEFYGRKGNQEPLKNINYNTFLIKVLNTLKERIIDENSKVKIDEKSHHDECMAKHMEFINLIKSNSKVEDCVYFAVLDYYNQVKINEKYGIISSDFPDTVLIDYIANEFYKNKWSEPPLRTTDYDSFKSMVLKYLNETNKKNKDESNEKTKKIIK